MVFPLLKFVTRKCCPAGFPRSQIAHVIAPSSSGLPFAISPRAPPVPSRRALSRLYHVAQPVQRRGEEPLDICVEQLIPPAGNPQLFAFKICATEQIKHNHVVKIAHFISPPMCPV
jgi:hypothetical protein